MPTREKNLDKMPTFGWHFVRLVFCLTTVISTKLLSTTLPINYTRLVCPWGSPSKRLRRSQIGLISNFPRVGPGFLETEVWALVKVGDRCSYCFLGKIEGLLCQIQEAGLFSHSLLRLNSMICLLASFITSRSALFNIVQNMSFVR